MVNNVFSYHLWDKNLKIAFQWNPDSGQGKYEFLSNSELKLFFTKFKALSFYTIFKMNFFWKCVLFYIQENYSHFLASFCRYGLFRGIYVFLSFCVFFFFFKLLPFPDFFPGVTTGREGKYFSGSLSLKPSTLQHHPHSHSWSITSYLSNHFLSLCDFMNVRTGYGMCAACSFINITDFFFFFTLVFVSYILHWFFKHSKKVILSIWIK